MCTQLTQNGRIIIPFTRAIITASNRSVSSSLWGAMSHGHPIINARMESLTKLWIPRGYELMTMFVSGFVELEKEFVFPRPREIGIVYKEDHFLVITEPAIAQVASVHHRQPCFINLAKLIAA
jgi:putative SOS response-associated peptidase YedK